MCCVMYFCKGEYNNFLNDVLEMSVVKFWKPNYFHHFAQKHAVSSILHQNRIVDQLGHMLALSHFVWQSTFFTKNWGEKQM